MEEQFSYEIMMYFKSIKTNGNEAKGVEQQSRGNDFRKRGISPQINLESHCATLTVPL